MKQNIIHTGDARTFAATIPDGSVDLVFTDPVYDRIEDYAWLAETAARVLRPNSAALVWLNTAKLPEVLNAMQSLTYRWQLIHYKPGRVKEKFCPAGYCKYESLLWFDKGRVTRRRWADLFQTMPFQSNLPMDINHKWSKNPDAIAAPLAAFTKPGALVFDPFAGGGTVPAVCKMLGRNYLACEIDPETAERARERVLNTQPPLAGLEVEQADMFPDRAREAEAARGMLGGPWAGTPMEEE